MRNPFEAVYLPDASTPDFRVKTLYVNVFLGLQWYACISFKTTFKTEDSSRIGWFMGTISSIRYADPVIWFYRYYQICNIIFVQARPLKGFIFITASPIKIVKLLSRKKKQKMVNRLLFKDFL